MDVSKILESILRKLSSGIPVSVLPAGTTATIQVRNYLTANSTAVVIKAGAGSIYGWNLNNTSATIIYVKIYDKAAASVNPASDVPIKTLEIAANGSVYQEPNSIQVTAGTALSARAVTGYADTDTTAPATLPILEWEIV